MQINQNRISKLLAFKSKNKFSTDAWEQRGLNPSSDEICDELNSLFNQTADDLIDALNNNLSNKQLLKILKSNLSLFRKQDYDTEEREFVCDVFFDLSEIVGIDFKDTLNKWLYGSVLSNLIKIRKYFTS